jgi:hypothetical protein
MPGSGIICVVRRVIWACPKQRLHARLCLGRERQFVSINTDPGSGNRVDGRILAWCLQCVEDSGGAKMGILDRESRQGLQRSDAP